MIFGEETFRATAPVPISATEVWRWKSGRCFSGGEKKTAAVAQLLGRGVMMMDVQQIALINCFIRHRHVELSPHLFWCSTV